MTEAEREMLLGGAGPAPTPRPKKPSRLRRVILGLSALALALALIVWLAGPSIAAALAPRELELQIAGRPGRLTLADLALSWNGPQRAGAVKLIDADGMQMADLALRADSSLLTALWSGELGTIHVSGALDLRETQLQSPPGPIPPPVRPGVPAATAPAPAPPIELPTGYRFTLETTALDITYSPLTGAPVSIKGLDIALTYDRGQSFVLTARSASPVASLNLSGANLTDARGVLTPATATADFSASATLPGALVDAIVAAFIPGATPSSNSMSGPTPDTRIAAAAQIRAGRLTLTGPASPIIIQTPLPGPAIAFLNQGKSPASVTQAPIYTITTRAIDLPIVAGASGFDLRGAALALSIKSTEARATISLAPGEPPRPVVISPWEAALDVSDFASGLRASGEARVLIDGAEAGAIRASADATGLLDDQGRLAAAPQSARAELRVERTPIGLFEPLVANRDFSLTDVLGETLDALVTVQTKVLQAAVPGEKALPAPPGSYEFTAQARSSHIDLWSVLVTDGTRIWSEGRAARIEVDRPGPALRSMLAEQGIQSIGAGLIIGEVHGLDLPLVSLAPDLSRATASIRLAVGDMQVRANEDQRPIELTSLQTNIELTPGPRLGAAIDYRIKSGQLVSSAVGQLDIVDLASKSTDGPPWVIFTPQRARPIGIIRLEGVPSDALGALPEPWAGAAREALGSALAGSIEFTAAESSRDIGVALSLTSPGAEARGSFVLDDSALRSVGDGLTIELKSPEPLARAAVAATPGAEVRWQSPLRVSLRDVTIPRAAASDLSSIAARLRVDLQNASLRLAADSPWIEASSLNLDASLAQGGTAALAIDGKGRYESSDFLANGNFSVSGLFAPGAAFDPAALRPRGQLTLTDIPGALARLGPGEVGAVAQQALGERFNIRIDAPAPASTLPSLSDRDGPSMRIDLAGQSLTAAADVRLFGRDLWVGPTGVDLNASPALLASIDRLLEAQGALPTLERNTRLRIDAQPIVFTFDQSGAPDLRTLRPILLMASASDDVIVGNLPLGPQGAARSVGLRGLTLGAAYHRNDMPLSEASLRTVIFDPADAQVTVAELDILSGLVFPRPSTLNATVSRIDTARLDRLLGRPGLTSEALGAEAALALVGATGGAGRPLTYQFTLRSPRLSAGGALVELPDRFQLTAPVALTWEAPASWLNANFLAPPADAPRPSRLAFSESLPLTAEIRSLSLGKQGIFTPGIFAIDVRASAPAAKFITDRQERITVEGVSFSLSPTDSPNRLAFTLATQRESVQRAGEAATSPLEPLRATGVIANFADSDGAFDSMNASVDTSITGALSTVILDVITRSDGLLVDLLGSVTNVNIQARELSRSGGDLTAKADTANAQATLEGAIEEDQFVSRGVGRITIGRITPELSARVFETVIPILTRLEKTDQDQPANLDTQGLTIPIDGNLANLNGRLRVDLGTVQFQTSNIIGQLLKASGNRAQGSLGRRVKPFEFVIANGVVAYDRIELPLGEFTLVTRGSVDLVNRTMDIVTYVPILAVADEVVKVTQFAPGLAMIPIRTKGRFGEAKSEIALDRLLDEGIPGEAASGVGGVITGIGSAIEQALRKKDEEDKQKKEKKKQKKQAKKDAQQTKQP